MVSQWVYTRFGIGIADEAWWDFRTRLFRAVTLPSILRHVREGVHWVIFTDVDIPSRSRRALDAIAGNHGDGQIIIRPLRFVCELPDALEWEVGRDGLVGVTRLDDDDAVSDDFFGALQYEHEPCIVSQPLGFEADLATRIMRPIHAPMLSLNTTFIGNANLIAEYARVGHHMVGAWADKRGIPTKEVQSESGRSFIYSRHKQSDTSFGARRKAIREDEHSVVLTASARSRFGFDEAAFEDWRQFARTAPSAPSSKTWDRTSALNEQAYRLYKDLADVRRQQRSATANIFQPVD
ncbi:hypothetical protein H9638_16640 [Arthrobacter sp. Sa2BUA2]|uniref:Rhamnosyl transferase n=1 Tax=Arthrobacter pullicola TaxID=2762224 RepID=A0ABR8YMF4_9MICC|nr:hypothetical protein [Arthrobacter pullicola]